MNKPTQQIKQMARNLFKAKTDFSYVKILHPKRDWLIGIGVGFCIVLGITVWNGYTYFTNRDGGTTDIEITIANPRYQAELVSQALGQFETRAAEFAALSAGVTSASPLEGVDQTAETNEQATTSLDTTEPDTVQAEEGMGDSVLEENDSTVEQPEDIPESTQSPSIENETPTLNE